MAFIHIGIFLFAGMHLFSLLLPAMRNRVSARLGENQYKSIYSVVSLLGVILMGYGYWQERHGAMVGVSHYEPIEAMRHVAMGLVLLAFIFIASRDGKGYIRKWVRHPFSIGFALWSFAHLLANGEVYVVPIFATFFAISILDIALGFARGGPHQFTPQLKRDGIAVIAGLLAFAIFAYGFHPYVLDLPVLR